MTKLFLCFTTYFVESGRMGNFIKIINTIYIMNIKAICRVVIDGCSIIALCISLFFSVYKIP